MTLPRPAGLLPGQRYGALRAGALGSIVVCASLVVIGAVTLVILMVEGFFGALGGMSTGDNPIDLVSDITLTLSYSAFIGVCVMAVGFVISHSILRTYSVNRAMAVLWAGFAVSLIPTVVFGLIFTAGFLFLHASQTSLNQAGIGVLTSVAFAIFWAPRRCTHALCGLVRIPLDGPRASAPSAVDPVCPAHDTRACALGATARPG